MNKRQKIIAIFVSALLAVPLAVAAEGSYQGRVLFSPVAEILLAEAAGRVMIDDGLRNQTVEKALDDQFGRTEDMKFVPTVYVQENVGDVLEAENGEEEECD